MVVHSRLSMITSTESSFWPRGKSTLMNIPGRNESQLRQRVARLPSNADFTSQGLGEAFSLHSGEKGTSFPSARSSTSSTFHIRVADVAVWTMRMVFTGSGGNVNETCIRGSFGECHLAKKKSAIRSPYAERQHTINGRVVYDWAAPPVNVRTGSPSGTNFSMYWAIA